MACELSGQPARAVLLLHAAAGVAIVLLVPWKSLVGKRGFRGPRSLKWAAVVLGIGVAISIVFGLVHASGPRNLGFLTAMDFHVGAAVCVIPFLLWHLGARPLKPRATDFGRRTFLKGGLLAGSAGLVVALLPSALRAPTGSFQSIQPLATTWMFDSVPTVDIATWRVAVASRALSYEELAGYTDRISAVIDCTGGWYSQQVWEGALLERLLPPSTRTGSTPNPTSITGYSRRFPIEDARRMRLPTPLAGSALQPRPAAPG